MNNILKLTSPMPPSVNHYTGIRTVMKKNPKTGKQTPMAMVYETAEAKKYKKEFKKIIETEVKKQEYDAPVNDKQHFNVDAVFYFDRIDKDAANYEKCLSDTITETQLIWEDDNVVLFRPQRIYYDAENPRIELTIYPVRYIGIFDNQEQLEQFECNCHECKRYSRNCSILKKDKEGRIQEEIQDLVCSKYKN